MRLVLVVEAAEIAVRALTELRIEQSQHFSLSMYVRTHVPSASLVQRVVCSA